MQGTRTIRRAALAVTVTAALGAAAAAPAGAVAPPPKPELFVLPPNGDELQLSGDVTCNDVVFTPLPAPPVAVAASCVDPWTTAPRLTLRTPATVRLRSTLPLQSLGASVVGMPPLAVTQRDEFLWNVALPAGLPSAAGLTVGVRLADRFAGGSSLHVVSVVAPPIAAKPAVAIVRAGLRGRTVTAVVRPSGAGTVSAYVAVAGTRRSGVVRATAGGGASVRLQLRLARRPSAALIADGVVTIVFAPADGQPAARAQAGLRAAISRL